MNLRAFQFALWNTLLKLGPKPKYFYDYFLCSSSGSSVSLLMQALHLSKKPFSDITVIVVTDARGLQFLGSVISKNNK